MVGRGGGMRGGGGRDVEEVTLLLLPVLVVTVLLVTGSACSCFRRVFLFKCSSADVVCDTVHLTLNFC